MRWDDLRFFLAVARNRTLSAAASALGVSQPTVGRRIAALEKELGATLLERSSDGLALSSAGRQVLELAERMELDALAVERRVSGRDQGVRGVVRVTASEWIVSAVLAPELPPLLERHPQLVVELVADQRHLNLARREADIALRPRPFDHDAVIQRSVAELGFGLYGSRAYLANKVSPAVDAGRGHVLVAMSDDVGDVARSWLASALPEATVAVRTNGREAMLALARAGAGLACLARVVGDAQPELVRITGLSTAPRPKLWMGIHRDARSTARVRVVAAYWVDRLQSSRDRLSPTEM
ncbi:MAG: LysR family transcriptional regulator [Polyangiaceae bacterium]